MSVFTPFLLLWCYLFYISGASSDNGMPRINFCVGLTTIPPRFSSVHHVVRSWLQQDLPPAIIVIFIPKKYTMFVNGIGRNKNKNFVTLTNELQSHFATEMDEGRVVLQLVSKDLGPLTKYIGMLEYFAAFDDSALGSIDRWVIGDDDVHYAAETLSGYANAISNHVPPSSVNEYVMTHFQVHTRVEILLDGDENIRHPIAHLQGVDTVMFPKALLQRHESSPTGIFTFAKALKVANFFHQLCPQSFFQDDYIISALLFAAHIPVRSIWSGSKVALHVDDVSTSFQQMHLSVDVFNREQVTKQCVEDNMSTVMKILYSA